MIKVYLDWSGLYLQISLVIFFPLIIYIVYLIINKLKYVYIFDHEVELNIPLGNIGNLKIKQNHDVVQIAHKAWTELSTRKANILYEQNHDVIIEVYNSWYILFSEFRSLIKNIPAYRLKEKNTQALVNLLVNSLNKGLRPHLTKWQAKFKKWYEVELEKKENKIKTPQEIQKKFPRYKDLVADLIRVNKLLVIYTNEIKKLTL